MTIDLSHMLRLLVEQALDVTGQLVKSKPPTPVAVCRVAASLVISRPSHHVCEEIIG